MSHYGYGSAALQPPWNLTVRSRIFHYVDVLNANLVSFDATRSEATFSVRWPYLTLGRQENNNIEIMIVVDYDTHINQVSYCEYALG
jgi:hypothetical protein